MVKRFLTIIILCWITFNAVTITIGAIQPHNPCTTPNGETASCIPLSSCPVIHNAVRSKNRTSILFAHDSECGQQGNTLLVCCGTVDYYRNNNFEYIINPYPPNERIKSLARSKRNSEDVEYIYSLFSTQKPQSQTIISSINNGSSDENLLILKDFDNNILPDRTVCGIHYGDDRIIGGEQTEYGEYPWMVALEYANRKSGQSAGVKCGGSIVTKRFVLTAAHCIGNSEFELVQARLGEWNLTSDPDCPNDCKAVTIVKIDKKIPHPFYNRLTKRHDIALLKLERDVEYTDVIRPICLPPENLPSPRDGVELMVSGWGLTEDGEAVSDVKLKVSVPVVSHRICTAVLKNINIGVNQLCAGGVSGKDACKGDSGGPLIRSFTDKNNAPQWYQEGIVSHGVDCGRRGYPGVYTRISRYTTWVLHTIETNGDSYLGHVGRPK